MPAVSVIMPIYNTRPTHLKAAIESILAQTYPNYEFIILNDSPENPTLKTIINTYQDPRIIYLENPANQGVAKSYNRLLESAASPLIALMNHDDIAAPDRLKHQTAYLSTHQSIGLLGTSYKKFGELKRLKTVTPPQTDGEIRALMLFKSPLHHPTIMFRRKIAKENHIRYNESYISLNDRQFYHDMSKVTKLANLSTPLYKYRFHKDMTSKQQRAAIRHEQHQFHQIWFNDHHITLPKKELDAFENYAANGRCQIRSKETLKNVLAVLEHLVKENHAKHFAPEKEFSKTCADYLAKRCLNAAFYGKISTKDILKTTDLPITPPFLLNLANYALSLIK